MTKMKLCQNSILLFTLVLFVFGIYFISTRPSEPFVTGQCPTTLIKDGNNYLVYNPNYAGVPGVNPMKMSSLEDYKEYVEWQRANKLKCPILHLEKVFDAQGAPMYEIRPSFDQTLNIGGMNHNLPVVQTTPNMQYMKDNAIDRPPFNCNQYPSYDKDNQNIGLL
jgi:hypothetical protein